MPSTPALETIHRQQNTSLNYKSITTWLKTNLLNKNLYSDSNNKDFLITELRRNRHSNLITVNNHPPIPTEGVWVCTAFPDHHCSTGGTHRSHRMVTLDNVNCLPLQRTGGGREATRTQHLGSKCFSVQKSEHSQHTKLPKGTCKNVFQCLNFFFLNLYSGK